VPVFRLTEELVFPDPALAEEGGLLAVGGDLRPERVVLAYRQGIFPWYSEGRPILWWCPAPRFVLLPDELHVGRTLRRAIKRSELRITLDTDFPAVIGRCAEAERAGQRGTWITDDVRAAFTELHRRGLAHSVEAWDGDRLVGGLYGLALGSVFFGESMFADAPDASKIAFVRLVDQLRAWGFDLIDCQVHTSHLERFGARYVAIEEFMARLHEGVAKASRVGRWAFEREG
jgi:leucyl/phenylalanyl-tRNA--protein transferase